MFFGLIYIYPVCCMGESTMMTLLTAISPDTVVDPGQTGHPRWCQESRAVHTGTGVHCDGHVHKGSPQFKSRWSSISCFPCCFAFQLSPVSCILFLIHLTETEPASPTTPLPAACIWSAYLLSNLPAQLQLCLPFGPDLRVFCRIWLSSHVSACCLYLIRRPVANSAGLTTPPAYGPLHPNLPSRFVSTVPVPNVVHWDRQPPGSSYLLPNPSTNTIPDARSSPTDFSSTSQHSYYSALRSHVSTLPGAPKADTAGLRMKISPGNNVTSFSCS